MDLCGTAGRLARDWAAEQYARPASSEAVRMHQLALDAAQARHSHQPFKQHAK
jgi:hypothetical protein